MTAKVSEIRRVTVGIVEVAGIVEALAAGFEELGLDARTILVRRHTFGYGNRHRGWLERACQSLYSRRSGHGPAMEAMFKLADRVLRGMLLLTVVFRTDLMVFVGGQTFLNGWDVRFLRLLGKRVIVLYCGSDSRPPYLNGAFETQSQAELVRLTKRLARNVRRTERFADVVLVNPLSAHLHERAFVCAQDVGMPSKPVSGRAEEATGDELRVLHAPSRTAGKGTALIRDAVERARLAGVSIEYTELTGVANERVLEALRRTDLVLDQAYSDTDLAGLPIEGARFGVPSLVGSNEPEAIRRWLDPGVDDRVFLCRSEDYATKLRELADDRDALRRVGANAARFVEDRCAPEAVARRMLMLADGRGEARVIEPKEIDYPWGWGMERRALATRLAGVVESGGWESLEIEHVPAVLHRIAEILRDHGFDRRGRVL